MKNIFSILLICCATSLVAYDTPVFEEEKEEKECCETTYTLKKKPVFEEDEELCKKCDDEEEADKTTYFSCCEEDEDKKPDAFFKKDKDPKTLCYLRQRPVFEEEKDDKDKFSSCCSWKRYNSNFGMEKISLRFPEKPTITQSSTLLTAYAYDHALMYSFAGYFPPIGNINPNVWFDDILDNLMEYKVRHNIYQLANGDWVMDYVAHDYFQEILIKGCAILTPFNGYILQCTKPNSSQDKFDYFVESFRIKCECCD